MKVKAILFDFDGVIVDSVHVKTEAFRELFGEEQDRLPAILDFHLANGGMSRFTKFEIIYRDILKRPLSAVVSRELGEKFSVLVKQKVVESRYLSGALEFIQKYSMQIPLFIASGTPQDELHEIVSQRGLLSCFKEIHGTPRTKPEIIRDIRDRYQFKSDEMPFVGDAINDYKASIETATPFYGYVLQEGHGSFPADTMIVHGFQELESRLFKE